MGEIKHKEDMLNTIKRLIELVEKETIDVGNFNYSFKNDVVEVEPRPGANVREFAETGRLSLDIHIEMLDSKKFDKYEETVYSIQREWANIGLR